MDIPWDYHESTDRKYVGIFSKTGNPPFVIKECRFDPDRQQGRFLPKGCLKGEKTGEFYVPGHPELRVRHRVNYTRPTYVPIATEFKTLPEAKKLLPGWRVV